MKIKFWKCQSFFHAWDLSANRILREKQFGKKWTWKKNQKVREQGIHEINN